MTKSFRTGIFIVVLTALCLPAHAESAILLDSLKLENIAGARINLNAWGPHIGFELEIAGGDPRLDPLLALIRDAEPGGGHKCSNVGAIRFRMKDGGAIGVGLLKSHTEGRYEFRLYDGDRYLEAYIVDRNELLAALGSLGVPTTDPAFE